MRFQQLRQEVCQTNQALAEAGLVALTFGNASGMDRQKGVMAIKPSGVEYKELRPKDIVVLSLETAEIVEGDLRPSSDTPTHLLLYQELPSIGGIVHTHSTYATCWAQAQRQVPCLGTTHADHFHGPVPLTRQLKPEEIASDYEHNTGKVIIEYLSAEEANPEQVPAALVPQHGPFVWGKSPAAALENAIALEEVARTALHTFLLNPQAQQIPQALLDKHFDRKHGSNSYYGQED